MVTMLQNDGQNVTAEDDAILYNALATGKSGIIKGCEMSITADNKIAIADGYLLIHGRVIKLNDVALNAEKPGDENIKTGSIYVQIDLADTENPAKILTSINKTKFDMEMSDINYDGIIYEYSIGEYTANSVSVLTVENTAERAGRVLMLDEIILYGDFIQKDKNKTVRAWIRDGGADLYNASGKRRVSIDQNGKIFFLDENGKTRILISESSGLVQKDENSTIRTWIRNGNLTMYNDSGTTRVHISENGDIYLKDSDGVTRAKLACDEMALYNEKGNVRTVLKSDGQIIVYDANGRVRFEMHTGEIRGYNANGFKKVELGQDALVFYNDDGTVNRRL